MRKVTVEITTCKACPEYVFDPELHHKPYCNLMDKLKLNYRLGDLIHEMCPKLPENQMITDVVQLANVR